MLNDYSPEVKSSTQFAKCILDAGVEVLVTILLNMALSINRADKDGDKDIDNMDEAIYDKMQIVYFRTFVMIFNTVAAPVIVVTLISEACFKNFFGPPGAVLTEYGFWGCVSYFHNLVTNVFSCQTFGWTMQYTDFSPVFIYNSTRSASLFTNYIPAVLFGYVTNLVVPWFLSFLPAVLGKSVMFSHLCKVNLLFANIFPGAYIWLPEEKPEFK
jgi:hypothetical protein